MTKKGIILLVGRIPQEKNSGSAIVHTSIEVHQLIERWRFYKSSSLYIYFALGSFSLFLVDFALKKWRSLSFHSKTDPPFAVEKIDNMFMALL